jgi:AmmeMemoRadiSam system protein B
MSIIRPTRFAGSWYPASAGQLDNLFPPEPTRPDAKLVGGAVPHAGLGYSARGQATLYARLPEDMRNFLLLAPSHYRSIGGDAFVGADYAGYDGTYRVLDAAADGSALSSAGVVLDDEALGGEHALELLLPGLARYGRGDLRLVALLTPYFRSADQIERLADQLGTLAESIFGEESWFLLVSSDFSHYGPRFSHTPLGSFADDRVRRGVRQRDLSVAQALCAGQWRDIADEMREPGAPTICGIASLMVQSAICRRRGWRGQVLLYYHSAELAGEYDGSDDAVAYATLAYRSGGEAESASREGP